MFTELAFCICTPQSKAVTCWKAISSLIKNGLLFKGSAEQIRPFLNVRFGYKKASYIVEARKFFTEDGKLKIKKKIQEIKNAFELREWLVENVKGFGLKEASHFLRNIGFEGLAILDRHVLKKLKEYGVIKEIPKSLTKRNYLEIENEMKKFSKRLKIPIEELDLLLWSGETGRIFK
ncbi:MAG: N-glycosylase/DNA lyase [Candidatus Aenigmarchaeota archaeon]|nr:N-glycosylase/DNA lyase [Candidatus Aenigmarchaeota archaeon]